MVLKTDDLNRKKTKNKIGYILYVDRFYVDHKFDIYIYTFAIIDSFAQFAQNRAL